MRRFAAKTPLMSIEGIQEESVSGRLKMFGIERKTNKAWDF